MDFENGPVFKELKEREAALKRKREEDDEEGRTPGGTFDFACG